MKKSIQKVASGLRRDEGVKWFPELSDKGREIIDFHCSFPLLYPKLSLKLGHHFRISQTVIFSVDITFLFA